MKAWKKNVNNKTINNCWAKSEVLKIKYNLIIMKKAKKPDWKNEIEYDHVISQIKNEIRDLIKQQRIINVMIIDQFLNSVSEIMKDENDDDLINVIADAYSKKERIYESNEKNVANQKISINEIIQTLHTLQLYEKQQN